MVAPKNYRQRNISPYIPKQGDIVWLDFDPTSGKEITKRRPAFVLSQQAFQQHIQMMIVAPITSTLRGGALEVPLSDEETQGAILVYQLRSVDFQTRNPVFIEQASQETLRKMLEIAQILVQ